MRDALATHSCIFISDSNKYGSILTTQVLGEHKTYYGLI